MLKCRTRSRAVPETNSLTIIGSPERGASPAYLRSRNELGATEASVCIRSDVFGFRS